MIPTWIRRTIVLAALIPLVGCEASFTGNQQGSDASEAGDAQPGPHTDATPAPQPVQPQPYTLAVEAGAERAGWSLSGSQFVVRVCAVLESGRKLRVYKASFHGGTPYCADSGAFDHTVLRLGGKYVNTPGAGSVEASGGAGAALAAGPTKFANESMVQLTLKITDPGDPTVAPAMLYVSLVGDTKGVSFTFSDAK